MVRASIDSFDTGLFPVSATDLKKVVQQLGALEDSEPLRERTWVPSSLFRRRKKTLTDSLAKQYLTMLKRFQEAQCIGVRKEKESLNRARAISCRQKGMSDSPFVDNFVPMFTPGQLQQQAVLPMEQERMTFSSHWSDREI
jgi:hypothetical protein